MRILLILCLLLGVLSAEAQLNTRLLSRLDYDAELNDIWGYTAPNGTEYALVGTTDGVSIVSLANPSAPREVAFVPGAFSLWRDLKTFGSFAYVTADQPGTKEGLLVIDLSGLPNSVKASRWRPFLANRDTLNTCHNLYIDKNGFAYLAGCNVNGGGVIFVDVATNPGKPSLAGLGPTVYAHDVFVQNDRMFTSEIYLGHLGIYDVTDKQEVLPLATQSTPFRFTHNAWASADGRYVFTTDERSNAPTAAYDISNLDNITYLDEYRPAETLGQGVIPHNVHVTKDNYLVISHYTDGVRIVDANRPDNLVEVAHYDTYPGAETGFHGAWGAYPFLPSGHVLVSDIENGLFVLDVDYVHASYLQGRVTSAAGGAAIRDASVTISATQANKSTTDGQGRYSTGLAGGGSFEVVFRHPEYLEKRLTVTLKAGEVAQLDVQLTPKQSLSIGGKVVTLVGNTAVPGASVVISNADFTYTATADANGRFQLSNVLAGTYDFYAGAWGYLHRRLSGIMIDNSASLTLTLEEGYQDDFIFDLGWTSAGTAPSGQWQRGRPDGVRNGDVLLSPATDIDGDLGNACYVTGNRGGGPGADDVDDGVVTLRSPLFDLSDYQNPILSYYLWFFDGFGGNAPNDTLSVYLTNGTETVTLEQVTESRSAWREQSVFELNGLLPLTATMQLIVETADRAASGNVVEAGFDAFLVRKGTTTATDNLSEARTELQAYPNPWREQLRVEYRLPDGVTEGVLTLYDNLGRSVGHYVLGQPKGSMVIEEVLPAGLYHLSLEAKGRRLGLRRVIKMDE